MQAKAVPPLTTASAAAPVRAIRVRGLRGARWRFGRGAPECELIAVSFLVGGEGPNGGGTAAGGGRSRRGQTTRRSGVTEPRPFAARNRPENANLTFC